MEKGNISSPVLLVKYLPVVEIAITSPKVNALITKPLFVISIPADVDIITVKNLYSPTVINDQFIIPYTRPDRMEYKSFQVIQVITTSLRTIQMRCKGIGEFDITFPEYCDCFRFYKSARTTMF